MFLRVEQKGSVRYFSVKEATSITIAKEPKGSSVTITNREGSCHIKTDASTETAERAIDKLITLANNKILTITRFEDLLKQVKEEDKRKQEVING